MYKRIICIIIILMMIPLCSCQSKNSIVGSWQSELGGIYTFEKDGSGVFENSGFEGTALEFSSKTTFTYTVEGEVLTIIETTENIEHESLYYYKIENDQLKLAVKNEGSERYYYIYNKVDTSNKQSDQEDEAEDIVYSVEIWHSALDGTVAKNEIGVWTYSAAMANREYRSLVKIQKECQIYDDVEGKVIGLIGIDSEIALFETKKKAGKTWYRIHDEFNWWILYTDGISRSITAFSG